jgi:hypothetical protein
MKSTLPFLLLAFVLILSACAPKPPASPASPVALANPPASGGGATDSMQMDQQGAVIVEVTPLNLSAPDSTLNFQVAFNTHSVDLSMDFTKLATLSTDNGNFVQATAWDGPKGGHHVLGTMRFPATENGKSLLDGATRVTLTLKDVDAPERVFAWNLGK